MKPADEAQKAKDEAKAERKRPEVEAMLRQFLNHDGPKGLNRQYAARWEYTFRLTDFQRAAVDALVAGGEDFATAVRLASQ